MKRFEITIRFDSEDYPAAIKRVAKLLRENTDISGTGILGAEPLTFEQGGENIEPEWIDAGTVTSSTSITRREGAPRIGVGFTLSGESLKHELAGAPSHGFTLHENHGGNVSNPNLREALGLPNTAKESPVANTANTHSLV